MPTFEVNDSRYILRMGHQVCATSTLTIMFAGMVCDTDDCGEKLAPTSVGRDFHVYLKIAVSVPNNCAERAVRLSMWNGRTCEDVHDTTHIGMEMDLDNEAVVKMGSPTHFHFKEFRGPPGAGHREGRLLFPGMTMVVEWSALDAHELIFMPTVDLPFGYMQILERSTERFCEHRLGGLKASPMLAQLDKFPIPDKPPDRAPKQKAGPSADKPPDSSKRARRSVKGGS